MLLSQGHHLKAHDLVKGLGHFGSLSSDEQKGTHPLPLPKTGRGDGMDKILIMHSVILGKKQIDFPSEWNEVSGEQLVELATIIHSRSDPREMMVRILLVLLNMRYQSLWVRFTWAFRVSAEFKYDCLRGAEWVLKSDYDCTEQKLPVILTHPQPLSWKKRGVEMYGPLDECRKIVFLEFIEADMAYLDFRRNFEDVELREKALNRLVAVLYRDRNEDAPVYPQPLKGSRSHKKLMKWNGDPRCDYNSNVLEWHERSFDSVPIGYKYAVLMFYHACHIIWEEMFPEVFKKADATSRDDDTTGSGDWAGALKSLAGGSVHAEAMGKVNAVFALKDLNDQIAAAEEVASK